MAPVSGLHDASSLRPLNGDEFPFGYDVMMIDARDNNHKLVQPRFTCPGCGSNIKTPQLCFLGMIQKHKPVLLPEVMDLDIGWGHQILGFDDQTNMISGPTPPGVRAEGVGARGPIGLQPLLAPSSTRIV